jgi:UDP-N-acetylglucosamine 2-epimerase (non-hydrolysing)
MKMKTLKIHLVASARPNFMKAAPLYHILKKKSWAKTILVHTGQHYDWDMSDAFFKDLELPPPHVNLGVGSGTHAEQTSRIMLAYEPVLCRHKPDLVIVVGDVNSTLACSLTAKKMLIPVAHVEAGLRSYDKTMPEEINRRLTDALADFLFTPSKDASENLLNEGVRKEAIFLVGNIMIDSLKKVLQKINPRTEAAFLKRLALAPREYLLATLHRPSNVDDRDELLRIFKKLETISRRIKIILPLHPRTKKNLKAFRIPRPASKNMIILKPMAYREFIVLEKNAKLVITDSGGVQEETTFFRVPCLTLRPNTERPITVTLGTNQLLHADELEDKVFDVLRGISKKGKIPAFWDGRTASRIVGIIEKKVRGTHDSSHR